MMSYLDTPTRRTSRLPRLWPRVAAVDLVTVPSPGAKPSRQSRAKRAVVAGVVLFVLVQSSLNLAVRSEWLPISDPVYHEKFAILSNHPSFFAERDESAPQRVASLGSSRTQLAFDAERFGQAGTADAMNLGFPAAGPLTQALYLRRMIDAGFRPDVLFLEIHPCFLAPGDPPFEAQWLHSYRLRPAEVELLRGFGYAAESPPTHGWSGWLTASYGYRFGILNQYTPVLLPCPFGLTVGARSDSRGFVAGHHFVGKQRSRMTAATYKQYAPVLENYATGGAGVAALRDSLVLCRDRGIRVGLVLMPESSDFRGWYGKDGYAAAGDTAMSLGREFGVPVFDARTWVSDEHHADGHHLTPAGAAEFTDRLAAESAEWRGAKR